jgi:UDP-N-acetylmuramoyl-tripeptide--D-alanyl-D-alanine ligase
LYNANNINAAITIGKYFNVLDSDIKSAIESYIPENNRSQLIYKYTNEIILDAYNANPSSMAVAIANFIQLERENKILILGDMFELGTESSLEHKAVVNSLLNEIQITCYFIGKDFYSLKIEKSNFHFYDTFDSFSNDFKHINLKDTIILIKGSRGMALERVLELI